MREGMFRIERCAILRLRSVSACLVASLGEFSPLFVMLRTDGRAADSLRHVTIEPGIAPHATGSALVSFGSTQVICAVMVDSDVPRWMREQEKPRGWLTAEYSMLPYSTLTRKPRDISRGKADSRGTEIQRLIGRSLRPCVDLEALGARTLWVDCDVLQADGGTRTAAITGACFAVEVACAGLVRSGMLEASPFRQRVAAVSCGLSGEDALLDLNYVEDRDIDMDLNIVMTHALEIVEVQGSAEGRALTRPQLDRLLDLGAKGIGELAAIQAAAFDAHNSSLS